MNLGFFTMPIHPVDKDWRTSLREDREAFILADELGYTEGYVGEHHTDRAENITSCDDVHLHADRGDQAHQARHRHHQHAEQPSGGGRGERRDARSSARRPLHLRHLARRLAVRRGGVRQSRCRPQRHVSRIHQSGAGDLGQRGALQHQGQVLEHRARAAAHARPRPGLICPSRCRSRIRRSSSRRSRRSRRA